MSEVGADLDVETLRKPSTGLKHLIALCACVKVSVETLRKPSTGLKLPPVRLLKPRRPIAIPVAHECESRPAKSDRDDPDDAGVRPYPIE